MLRRRNRALYDAIIKQASKTKILIPPAFEFENGDIAMQSGLNIPNKVPILFEGHTDSDHYIGDAILDNEELRDKFAVQYFPDSHIVQVLAQLDLLSHLRFEVGVKRNLEERYAKLELFHAFAPLTPLIKRISCQP